jgi:hypothetical protein
VKCTSRYILLKTSNVYYIIVNSTSHKNTLCLNRCLFGLRPQICCSTLRQKGPRWSPNMASSIIQLSYHLHYYSMVFVLLQTTDDHNCNDTFNTCHPDRNSAAMYGIFASTIPKTELLSKGYLVLCEPALSAYWPFVYPRKTHPIKFTMHIPSTASPPQNCLPLSCNPIIVVWHNTRMCAGTEEDLILVRKRNINHYRCR